MSAPGRPDDDPDIRRSAPDQPARCRRRRLRGKDGGGAQIREQPHLCDVGENPGQDRVAAGRGEAAGPGYGGVKLIEGCGRPDARPGYSLPWVTDEDGRHDFGVGGPGRGLDAVNLNDFPSSIVQIGVAAVCDQARGELHLP